METHETALAKANNENRTEINNTPAIAANPLDLPAEIFQEGLGRRKQNRAALMDWVREALVVNLDFGKIHVVGRSTMPGR